MTDPMIVALETISVMGYIVAIGFATKLHRKTIDASQVWFLILGALITGAIFSFLTALEWTGFRVSLMECLEGAFMPMTSVLWLAAAYSIKKGVLKPI
ncbi:MAG: hypothetical protein QMC77_06395 [Methanocellales archaeon]|nr:hypothetical protein [Methanocellales archaeon]